MMTNRTEKHMGLYFIMLSLMLAVMFYAAGGFLLKYSHPFYNLKLFPLFLVLTLAFSVIIYFVSFRSCFVSRTEEHLSAACTTVIIIVSALFLSGLFPAFALVGLYPVTMAGPHMLLLFFCGLSLGAVILSGMVVLFRSGLLTSARNWTVFAAGTLVPLGVAFMSLHLLKLMQAV